MKKLFYFVLISTMLILSSCSILDITFMQRPICDADITLSRQQVEKDLNDNEQDYLDMIELVENKDITFINIYKDTRSAGGEYIWVRTYDGNIEEWYDGSGEWEKSHKFKLYEFDGFSEVEKNSIKIFISDRHSETVKMTIEPNNTYRFEFFGLTSIKYENGDFQVVTRECPESV